MKCKYKKFLKAAYIDYEEDYCSNAVLRSSRPPQSEILAPATFETTLSSGEGYYWTTFYTSMANYKAPEGVIVYKYHAEGSSLTRIPVEDRIINKGQGVVLKSSTSSVTLTKTYSKSSDDYSDNSLIGTDYQITNPGHAYVLSYKSSHGIAFYRLSSTGKIKANRAYLIVEDTYLTQWKLMGNSTVHTDPYLTSWKVSGNSQVHTLPYPDGVVLPTGYKRCEYLEFHGTEYIDSGIIPEQGIAVSVNSEFTTLGSTDCGLLGCREDAYSSDSLYFLNQRTNHQFVASYGGAVLTQDTPSNPSININQRVSIILDSSKIEITVNDNTFVQSHTKSIVKGDRSIYIGKVHNAGYANYSGKMYSITMSLSDALVFNGIPCLDDNDVPCLYDTISQTTLYNQGSGTFGYELYPQPTEIWSCGDYSAVDSKYHVKISNGVDVFDIALTEPLRKVNDVADKIEFSNGSAVLTRNFASANLGSFTWLTRSTNQTGKNRYSTQMGVEVLPNCIGSPTQYTTAIGLCSIYNVIAPGNTYGCMEGIAVFDSSNVTDGQIFIYDSNADTLTYQEFKNYVQGIELLYQITPTTEIIDAPQISVSPTDTYTSANAVPFSAFTHTENKEIWSCGEYNATDGKYHILVQPLGGSIADIALTEPLRKVNNVADTIEFPSDTEGKALVTRNLALLFTTKFVVDHMDSQNKLCLTTSKFNGANYDSTKDGGILCNKIEKGLSLNNARKYDGECFALQSINVWVRNGAIEQTTESYQSYFDNLGAIEVVYQLSTPTTELVDAPQIQEAESYSMVISQGGKAIGWSSFETE